MSVDLRRFTYALEPLLRQRKWQLEALLTRLGLAQAEVQEAEEVLAVLRERHRAVSHGMALALTRSVNPSMLGLQWLAQLKFQILEQEETLLVLRAERAEIRAKCQAHHHKVEVLDEHRADCVFEFAREEAGRQFIEADRDWIARIRLTRQQRPHRGKMGSMTPYHNMTEGGMA